MRYIVKVKRTVEHFADIPVSAADEDEASEKAIAKAENDNPEKSDFEWELEDTQFDAEDVNEE
jgi:hypothetical protein